MVFYLKYEYGEKCPVFRFTIASEAKAHISDNFDDVVWLAYAQKPPKENEDSPDFFVYESIEEAHDAIDEAYIKMGGDVNTANKK